MNCGMPDRIVRVEAGKSAKHQVAAAVPVELRVCRPPGKAGTSGGSAVAGLGHQTVTSAKSIGGRNSVFFGDVREEGGRFTIVPRAAGFFSSLLGNRSQNVQSGSLLGSTIAEETLR